jgi:hypothetical protein
MSSYDLFGHYIPTSNATFKPKQKVKINALGPWFGLNGFIINYEGNDKYSVSISYKDKPSSTFNFHRSELISAEV